MGSSKQTERESLRAVFVEDNEFAFKLAFLLLYLLYPIVLIPAAYARSLPKFDWSTPWFALGPSEVFFALLPNPLSLPASLQYRT